MSNFEPTILDKCVLEIKIWYFLPFQDISSYNCRESLSKYIDMKCVKDQNYDTSTLIHFYSKIDSDLDIDRGL